MRYKRASELEVMARIRSLVPFRGGSGVGEVNEHQRPEDGSRSVGVKGSSCSGQFSDRCVQWRGGP